tara:strand:+ start:205 stop:543 length:339 start_codon:yes stop_codon:yes gene_type:complete
MGFVFDWAFLFLLLSRVGKSYKNGGDDAASRLESAIEKLHVGFRKSHGDSMRPQWKRMKTLCTCISKGDPSCVALMHTEIFRAGVEYAKLHGDDFDAVGVVGGLTLQEANED